MKSITDVTSVETFCKNDQRLDSVNLFWNLSKMAQNWAYEA